MKTPQCGQGARPPLVQSLATTTNAEYNDACGGIRVSPATGQFVDGCGRSRVFRGVNVVYKAPPWHPDVSVFSPGNSITQVDMQSWASMGWNLVRLGMMWVGVEPSPGAPNATYLNVMANLTASLYTNAGVYTLVDAHQDLLSDAFCADGAPHWEAYDAVSSIPANASFPWPVDAPFPVDNSTGQPIGCGKHSWAEYYFSAAVSWGFQQLYTNATHTARYASFWSAVVTALSEARVGPAVLSYELINEPWPGDIWSDPLLLVPGVADATNLQPFYTSLASAIRAAENATGTSPRIISCEPITFDLFIPAGFTALPGATEGLAALSHHYYIAPDLDPDMELAARAQDAARLGAASLLSEFDIAIADPWEPISQESLRHVLDLADSHITSYTGWAYSDMWYSNGSFSYMTATEMSRPFPMAVAGAIHAYQYVFPNGSEPAVFQLNYTLNPVATAPTTVYVNTDLHFVDGFTVSLQSTPYVPLAYSIEWHNATTGVRMQADEPPVFNYAYVHIGCSAACATPSLVWVTLTSATA